MKIKKFFTKLSLVLTVILLEIYSLVISIKFMKYLYLGALMLFVSTVLAIVFFGWKLALIIFLAVQGNEIVQHANDRLSNTNEYFNDGVTPYDKKYESDFYKDNIHKR